MHHPASEYRNEGITLSSPETKTQPRAWVVVLVASLFFFYEFIQMNMMDAISQSLMQAFHARATLVSELSSYYFIATLIFLFTAGSLLDRFSTRKIILVALAICVLGTGLFGLATSFFWVSVCRFLTGIGSAFCFVSVLRLATRWFPARRMALVTGLVVTIAMVGGMVAQTPFTLLSNAYGWRHTLFIDAVFGLFVFLAIALTIQDFPKNQEAQHAAEQTALRGIGYWQSLRIAFIQGQNWLGGIYSSMINLPINVLGGLWGIPYLAVTQHISGVAASRITSMLFLGMIIGSPIAGWLSDRIARRKPVMIVGAVVSIVLSLFVMIAGHLDYAALLLLFFLIGLFSSAQIIAYPLVAESSRRVVTAMSVSVVNISVISGIAIGQWSFGRLMDQHAKLRLGHYTLQYVPSDFHWAMLIFLGGMVIALLAALLVKETYCVQRED